MRFLLALIAFALAASTADAQLLRRNRQQSCPSCPAPQFVLPGGQFQNCPGGVCRPAVPLAPQAVPQAMEAPASVPAPKFVESPASPRDKHGRMFYRHVADRVYGGLIDKGMDRTKARKLAESLSHESIDTYGEHVRIYGEIGDGKLLDWLLAHKEEIRALIKLIISLLAVA